MTFIVRSENIFSFIRSTRSNDSDRFHERIRSKNVIDSIVARKSRQGDRVGIKKIQEVV